MARVYQAYDCDYAIHLDMNSASQAYIGLFSNTGDNNFIVEHPVKEMAARDSSIFIEQKKMTVPRYVGTPDQSDFFISYANEDRFDSTAFVPAVCLSEAIITSKARFC